MLRPLLARMLPSATAIRHGVQSGHRQMAVDFTYYPAGAALSRFAPASVSDMPAGRHLHGCDRAVRTGAYRGVSNVHGPHDWHNRAQPPAALASPLHSELVRSGTASPRGGAAEGGAPAEGGAGGGGWRYLVALCALSVVICYADRSNISTAIVPMAAQFGWDKAFEGVVLSSFFAGYAATQVRRRSPAGCCEQLAGHRPRTFCVIHLPDQTFVFCVV